MTRVHSNDTQPEMRVRRLVHGMGYRYRLHRKDLPGNPDLVFPKRRKIIFVHGCFWHGPDCKAGRKRPKANEAYWSPKLARNRERDAANHGVCHPVFDAMGFCKGSRRMILEKRIEGIGWRSIQSQYFGWVSYTPTIR